MRYLVSFLASLSALATAAAQPPLPPAQPGNAAEQRLEQVLARWEKDTSSLQMMLAEFTCSRKNNVFNKTEKYTGFGKLMRPNLLRIEMTHDLDKGQYEKLICTGTHVFMFHPEYSRIDAYSLPPKPAGQAETPDDGPIPFIFGMKADVAKKRYQLKVSKEDQHYVYIDVFPNFDRDKADFTYARVVLLRENLNPKQIYWVEPGKVEVTYDITRILRDGDAAKDVRRTDFVKPDTPRGWELKLNDPPAGDAPPRPGTPTKIRPQG